MTTRASVKRRQGQFTRPSHLRHSRGYVRVVAGRATEHSRRGGRPRRSGAPAPPDARNEILAVASRLFAERGVDATTMAEIARRSGLQQSSLYYYFGSRAEVLGAVVAEANRAPLELVERVRGEGGAPSVQLYRIIRADVIALSALPYDLNELHRLAAREARTFARYWKEREQLIAGVGAVVAAAIAAGELLEADPRLVALTLLSNDEATQNWMRHAPRRNATDPGAGGPFAVGTFLADLALRGLLVRPQQLDTIRRRADALDVRAVAHA